VTRSDDRRAPGTGTARLLAWSLYDWANNAYATVIQTFVFAAYFTARVAEDETSGTSHWGSAIAVAGGVVAVGAPVLGALADEGGRRKPWLAVFTLLCVAATAGLWWVAPDPSHEGLALVLVATASAGSSLAVVFYDALLPALAPRRRIGSWSGFGWGLGYAGGVLCLLLALGAFLADEPWIPLDRSQGLPARATCLLAAGWYALFAAPLLLVRTDDPRGGGRPLRETVRGGLRRLATTVREASRHAGIARFLLARMLYADGLATLFSFGGVYAAGTFDMDEAEVLRFGIGLSLSAALGAWLFTGVDDRVGGKRSVALALVGLLLGGTAAVLAADRAAFWTAALFLGLFVGPAQAASRSYLARMAPESLRNEMFGLYALSGRITAFAGPALVAAVTSAADSQRAGMAVVLAFFAAGLLVLGTVPSDRPALREARATG